MHARLLHGRLLLETAYLDCANAARRAFFCGDLQYSLPASSTKPPPQNPFFSIPPPPPDAFFFGVPLNIPSRPRPGDLIVITPEFPKPIPQYLVYSVAVAATPQMLAAARACAANSFNI